MPTGGLLWILVSIGSLDAMVALLQMNSVELVSCYLSSNVPYGQSKFIRPV